MTNAKHPSCIGKAVFWLVHGDFSETWEEDELSSVCKGDLVFSGRGWIQAWVKCVVTWNGAGSGCGHMLARLFPYEQQSLKDCSRERKDLCFRNILLGTVWSLSKRKDQRWETQPGFADHDSLLPMQRVRAVCSVLESRTVLFIIWTCTHSPITYKKHHQACHWVK